MVFREKLAQAGLIDKLFDQFDRHLDAKGYIARGGQMVDASIVPAPKQRNTREENEALKRGETPAAWEEKPAKNRQKDKDARWTKKHGKSFFGYKNHVNVDRRHKLIRRYAVTDAAEHDSRQLDGLLRQGNTSRDVFGDSAYRSAATEARLKAQGFRSRIHVRATRGHPLSKAKAAANRAKSRIRARIEHVFGAQETAPGGRLVRTIGIVRARLKIGTQNFVYTSTPRESEDPPCQTARSGFYRTDDTARLSGHRIAAKPDRVGSGRVGRSSSGPTCERAGVARRWDELRGDCEGPVAGRRHHPHLVSPV